MFSVKEEPVKVDLRLQTIIGPGTQVNGDIEVQGGLRVDGSVTGKVVSSGPLTVGQEGRIKAPSVEAVSATIGGFLDGDITAPERIRLERTARVNSNMVTRILIIEEGAVFNGSSDMSNKTQQSSQPQPQTK
jgi:cytoskeletal protein CcmA (bactofilin family)